MANRRRSYSQAEQVALTTQVEGCCPLCNEPLFHRKGRSTYKTYELAHIYPLNPKPEEVVELQGVAWLSEDINDPENIIPLCTKCHTKFDKPRTREEYEQLAAVKRFFAERARQRTIFNDFPLENDIRNIIARLHEIDFEENQSLGLDFDAKSMDAKFDDSMPMPTRRKIRHAVIDYYQHVRNEFRNLEQQSPCASKLIYSQVHTYYLKQQTFSLSQADIFANVVEWIRAKTATSCPEAAEIVASFFVQNCEVLK